jgi:ATP-dependent Lon protease
LYVFKYVFFQIFTLYLRHYFIIILSLFHQVNIEGDDYQSEKYLKLCYAYIAMDPMTKTNGIVIINPKKVCIGSMPPAGGGDDDDDDYEDAYDDTEEDEYEDESEDDCCDEEDDEEEHKKPENRKANHKRFRVVYQDDEKEYFTNLPKKKRTEIQQLEEDISKINTVLVPLRFKLLESNMDIKLKAFAVSKLERLYTMDPSSGEYSKLTNYIEQLCKLPIGVYKPLPVNPSSHLNEITSFLTSIKKHLDDTVYGHEKAKDQIIRLLAKWISNPNSSGLVIGIEGPPGTGKTSLCNSICEVLQLPFGFISLGGSSDASTLVGHSLTYEGSKCGRISEILMAAECMNPVLFFDELDKISTTRYGDEIVNTLIHLTDAAQNSKFHDKYFSELELDLSKCLIVFSYNNVELVNPILKDRMVTIQAQGYKVKDKVPIAKNYLLPRILKEFGFNSTDVCMSDEVIEYIIGKTPDEEGVRNLKRSLEEIVSQVNLNRILQKDIIDKVKVVIPMTITNAIVDAFIEKNDDGMSKLHHMYL